jgi:putative ABC transport system permease protein
MIKNNIKIAWRNMVKNPVLGSLNIIGLAIGFAFVFLMLNYVWVEIFVNKELKNVDEQYIIQSRWKDKNQGVDFTSFGPLAKELREEYPNLIANYYRYDGINASVSIGDKHFKESVQIGDSTLLNMFGFGLKYGDEKTAFTEPFTILLSETKALKYFGKTDIVGNILQIENFSGQKKDFRITGVLSESSKNSINTWIDGKTNDLFINDMNLDFFGRNMSWANPYIVNHIALQPDVKIAQVEDAITKIIRKNVPEQSRNMTPYLTSLNDYYLDYNGGFIRKLTWAMSIIGIFIFLMAALNFINISISKSSTRMKEIGLRKALGSYKSQMVKLFLAESYLNVTLALAFSIMVYWLAKPSFENIVNNKLIPIYDLPLHILIIKLLMVLALGFIGGLYPAFVLSSMQAFESLKGKLPNIKVNTIFKKSLLVFQFTLAMIVLAVTAVITQQIDLFLNDNLGYNNDRIVTVPVPRDWSPEGVNKMMGIRDQFANLSTIASASLSYEIMNGNNGNNSTIFNHGADTLDNVATKILRSDEHFLSTYEIPLISGSNFKGRGMDVNAIIINESVAQALGYNNSNNAVGQKIRFSGDPIVYSILGICADFHFGSKHEKIVPIVFINVESDPIYRYLSFKLKNGSLQEQIVNLEKSWNQLLPGSPFEYSFMDQTIASLYTKEIQLKKALTLATWLALIIVVLGIVSMVSISLQNRIREIGIRKVLGSTASQIIILFVKEFILIILLATLVSVPTAYIIAQNWLNSYAYSIEINAIPFLLAFVTITVISMSIISFQIYKSATLNPIRSLKDV